MKKGFDARLFAFAIATAVLIAVFVGVNVYNRMVVNETKNSTVCYTASDCEEQNLPHILCVGNWLCEKNVCNWICRPQEQTNQSGSLGGSTVECYEDVHCPLGSCTDGTTYKRYSCLENKCREIQYFADPCRFR